jgi:hypothetical protein
VSKECAVCEEEKQRRFLQYLQPLEDWICDECLAKGHEHQVQNIEDGRQLTKEIRQGEK